MDKDYPTTIVIELNGMVTTWGLNDPKFVQAFINTMKKRGHRVRLIRSLTDMSAVNAQCGTKAKCKWYKD